jgi:hypothetical protein
VVAVTGERRQRKAGNERPGCFTAASQTIMPEPVRAAESNYRLATGADCDACPGMCGSAWAARVSALVALLASAADRRVWRLQSLWMLAPIVVPVLLLAFGVVFQHTSTTTAVPEWPKHVVEWFPWLLLPLGLALLVCFRSVSKWLIVLSVSTAALWLSFGAGVMSWMSVTNIWL